MRYLLLILAFGAIFFVENFVILFTHSHQLGGYVGGLSSNATQLTDAEFFSMIAAFAWPFAMVLAVICTICTFVLMLILKQRPPAFFYIGVCILTVPIAYWHYGRLLAF